MFDGIAEHEGRKTRIGERFFFFFFFYETAYFFYCFFLFYSYLTIW